MKRKLLGKQRLKQAALAVPAAALMLGASQAAQIGINFQDNWYGTPYAPMTDTSAFGIPLASWFNAPSVENSGFTPFSTNATFALPGGGTLALAWSAKNTYSLYAAIPTLGDDQVIYGYLDDTDYGYTVTLTGLRAFASSFTITTIASTDNGTAFQDVNVYSKTETNTLQYLNNYVPSFAAGLAGLSTVSPPFVTLNGNDTVVIRGLPPSGTSRSCLAGIILDYTPGNNAPLIEVNPQTPPGTIFAGQSFSLSAVASGTPPLAFQWRKGGAEISGATDATYVKSGATTGDTGNYDVVVTNAYGAVTSTVAAVTITPVVQPIITKAPVSQTFYQGYPATFTVQATGGQLSYLWKKNTQVIADATNASLTLPAITTADAGTYEVTVSNPVGTASASATLTVTVPASAYEAAVAATKPLVWFRASETVAPADNTGTAANSGSLGAAGNGIARRYVKFQEPGAIVGDASNTAAEFNSARTGNDGKMVDVPYNAALNPATFTAELWVKPTDTSTSARSPLYNRGAGAADGFLFFAHNATTKWQFRTYSGATGRNINSTVDVVPGVWTHLVGVYDASTGTQRFYVNGVEQGSLDAPGFTPNTSLLMRIGSGRNDLESGANMLLFKGHIDEVAIYNTALSAAEILAHYENATNAARTVSYESLVLAKSPVGYWRFNDPAGPVAPVVVNSGTLGAEWNGAYGFAPQPGTTGPRPPGEPGLESTNVALTTGTSYGHIGAPTCPALNVNTITVAGWLKRDAIPSSSDIGWPCWLGDGGMHIENSSGRPTGELRYHWKGGQWGWGSGLVVPEGVWTFVAMVVEPTKATFYMSDGTTLKTSVNTANHAALSVYSPLGFSGNQPDRVDRNYLGQQDEFAVYNRALSLSEINTLFMAGTGAKLELSLIPGGVIEDTKPVGTPHHGFNSRSTWIASSTDDLNVTRNGVQVFATANPSQIVVPADPDFNSPTGTITFWMRANAPIPGPGNEGAIIFDRRTSAGTVIVLDNAGQIFVQCSGGANSPATGYLPDLRWHHVAVTYDQAAGGLVEIYIDGFLSAQSPNASAWSWPASQQIELGRSHDGYWKRYDGELDDFRIYNRVLTGAEIGQIYASDALVDVNALKLRFNFDNTGIGKSVVWPFGTLQSSPVLGPAANWTPVPGATSPYPFLPTQPSLFFRAVP